ncbi:organic cation transporter protein-like [Ostrinia nubilalis]|uniref:organic cation transporter protein-like n=1 Tax=Ostrinia nubilalis TaxID=29057 RepID=UPI00308264C8
MAKPNSGLELDAILAQLGPFGRYNLVNYAFLLFPVYLAGIFGSIYVFEAPDINYRCHVSECAHLENTSWVTNAIPLVKEEFSKCTRYQMARDEYSYTNDTMCVAEDFKNKTMPCAKFDYSEEEYSIVKDFDLGCQDMKRTLVGTIHNAGLFVSLPLTGIISDRFGRRTALSIASLMNGIFGILRSFSINYEMFMAFEFLETAMGAGAYSTAFVLAMELVGPKGRVFGNTIINVLYVFGVMTLSGLSWYLQNWRQLLRIVYTPALLVFSYLWILNESVRWLLSKGRTDEAVAILNKAAKMNNVELSEELLSPLYHKVPLEQKEEVVADKESSTFIKVVKSSIIRQRLVVCSFLWITCTFVYYGLSINSVSLAGNKYLNFMLVGFVEIPANFACFLVLDRFGRKRTLITTYVLSACLCISLSFLPKGQKWLSLVIYLSGKFSITVAYSSVYIYVSEVFPTNVRQSLLAVCSSLGRVGSTLAPLTQLLFCLNLPTCPRCS